MYDVEPVGTNQTRLLVRQAMRLALGDSAPVVSAVTDLGAFVMEWRMIKGLKRVNVVARSGQRQVPRLRAVQDRE